MRCHNYFCPLDEIQNTDKPCHIKYLHDVYNGGNADVKAYLIPTAETADDITAIPEFKGTLTEKTFTDDDIITNFSGLSMYLPGAGDSELDAFYKTLSWNKDTNLVE